MSFVIAIEPDVRQAAMVRRVLDDYVRAELLLVSSKDQAIDAITERIPDLILTTQLLSPRDERGLMAFLRELDDAGHLQTLTIPLLADPDVPHVTARRRGVLDTFRRRTAAPAAEGCALDVFADEVRTYLQQTAEIRAKAASSPRRVTLSASVESVVSDVAMDVDTMEPGFVSAAVDPDAVEPAFAAPDAEGWAFAAVAADVDIVEPVYEPAVSDVDMMAAGSVPVEPPSEPLTLDLDTAEPVFPPMAIEQITESISVAGTPEVGIAELPSVSGVTDIAEPALVQVDEEPLLEELPLLDPQLEAGAVELDKDAWQLTPPEPIDIVEPESFDDATPALAADDLPMLPFDCQGDPGADVCVEAALADEMTAAEAGRPAAEGEAIDWIEVAALAGPVEDIAPVAAPADSAAVDQDIDTAVAAIVESVDEPVVALVDPAVEEAECDSAAVDQPQFDVVAAASAETLEEAEPVLLLVDSAAVGEQLDTAAVAATAEPVDEAQQVIMVVDSASVDRAELDTAVAAPSRFGEAESVLLLVDSAAVEQAEPDTAVAATAERLNEAEPVLLLVDSAADHRDGLDTVVAATTERLNETEPVLLLVDSAADHDAASMLIGTTAEQAEESESITALSASPLGDGSVSRVAVGGGALPAAGDLALLNLEGVARAGNVLERGEQDMMLGAASSPFVIVEGSVRMVDGPGVPTGFRSHAADVDYASIHVIDQGAARIPQSLPPHFQIALPEGTAPETPHAVAYVEAVPAAAVPDGAIQTDAQADQRAVFIDAPPEERPRTMPFPQRAAAPPGRSARRPQASAPVDTPSDERPSVDPDWLDVAIQSLELALGGMRSSGATRRRKPKKNEEEPPTAPTPAQAEPPQSLPSGSPPLLTHIEWLRRTYRAKRRAAPLAAWARTAQAPASPSPSVGAAAPETAAYDLRQLLAFLRVPQQVAGVTYVRACRIRRVKIVSRPRPRAKGGAPVIIVSSKALRQLRSEAPPEELAVAR